MSKANEANWTERLRALGFNGKLPAALTDAVIEAVRRRPLGARYVLPDGKVPGLSLRVGAGGAATFSLVYRTRRAGDVATSSARSRWRQRAPWAMGLLAEVAAARIPPPRSARRRWRRRTSRRCAAISRRFTNRRS